MRTIRCLEPSRGRFCVDCNPATANLIIRNSARGNTVDYDILAGNNSGAIILSPGVGFNSTNPRANFEF